MHPIKIVFIINFIFWLTAFIALIATKEQLLYDKTDKIIASIIGFFSMIHVSATVYWLIKG